MRRMAALRVELRSRRAAFSRLASSELVMVSSLAEPARIWVLRRAGEAPFQAPNPIMA